MVGSHVTTIDGNGYAILRLGSGIRQVDGHLGGKAVVGQVVFLFRVVGRSDAAGRLSRRLVNFYREGG